MKNVLIVSADTEVKNALLSSLQSHCYSVDAAGTNQDEIERFINRGYGLVVIDASSISIAADLCRMHRRAHGQSAILVLSPTACEDALEKVFDAGADDHLVFPVGGREFIARVRALLRRSGGVTMQRLRVKDIELDCALRVAIKDGKEIKLLPKELALLEFFMRNTNKLLSSEQIFDQVWQGKKTGTTSALRTTLSTLRQKIGMQLGDGIETIHGCGFRMINR